MPDPATELYAIQFLAKLNAPKMRRSDFLSIPACFRIALAVCRDAMS
jgi:hypothetical protein